MQQQVLDSLSESDVILFVLDATQATDRIGPGDRYVARLVAESGTPAIAVINKVDTPQPRGGTPHRGGGIGARGLARDLPDKRRRRAEHRAVDGGCDRASTTRTTLLPGGQDHGLPGVAYPRRVRQGEGAQRPQEEVPHAVAVEIEEVERKESVTVVYATIHVERPTQRMIVLGKGGKTIKRIGVEARRDVERLLGNRIYLDLKVKVSPGWRRQEVPGAAGVIITNVVQ